MIRIDSTKNADTDWKIKENAKAIEESSTKSKVPTFPTDIVSKHKGTCAVGKSGNGHLIILSLNLRGFGQR